MTTVPMFENKTFIISDDSKEVCEEAGFEFINTKSMQIMLRYETHDLTVFETGSVSWREVGMAHYVDSRQPFGSWRQSCIGMYR